MKASISVVVCVLAGAATAHAQVPALKSPDASPAATVSQAVGLTQIKVDYHRPGINGRPIWGALVPYGEVWRAGANENTTISFSTDVTIEGKALHAGTYGLHMIPTKGEWTVIFSNMAVAWGSFSYDQKEDALRVTVTPRPLAAPVERLAYAFDNPGETQATLILTWEKLAVPIKIEVDTPRVVMASMRADLRGQPRFSWDGWQRAAAYWVAHDGNLDEATTMIDQSITLKPTFPNRMTRARILDKKGDAAGAKDERTKALALASEVDLNVYGYQLMQEKKLDEAIGIFQRNAQAHADSWNVHDSLGEALLAKGDKKGSAASYEKALKLVKDPAQKKRIEGVLAQLKSS